MKIVDYINLETRALSHYQPLTASATQSNTAVQAGNMAVSYVSVSGGVAPYAYQWYERTSPVGGSNAQLAFYPNTAGTYSYYCKITDSEGTTANSSTLTLTVTSPTPSPSPTPQPSSSPSPSPSASPSPSPPPSPTSATPEFALPPEATIAIAAAVIIIVIAAIAIALKKRAK